MNFYPFSPRAFGSLLFLNILTSFIENKKEYVQANEFSQNWKAKIEEKIGCSDNDLEDMQLGFR